MLRHRGAIVMDVDIEFLTGTIRDELPYVEAIRHEPRDRELPAVDVERLFPRDSRASRRLFARAALPPLRLGRCAARPSIPRGAADAGVLAPVPGSPLGVALSVAGNPRYGRIDARYAAERAVIEAVRSDRRGRARVRSA